MLEWSKNSQTDTDSYITYQLFICLHTSATLGIGKLGIFQFPGGMYLYTVSAKRGMQNRLLRHLAKQKTLRWHIDYLLAFKGCEILDIRKFREPECHICQTSGGVILVPGFGSSDCTSGCGSHLRYLGNVEHSHTY